MEANRKRTLRSGQEYDHLFPAATGGVYTVRKNASLDDTVKFIPQVVRSNRAQTRGIAQRLKGDSLYETCSNIWHFVYGHIQYRKDQPGYEQIRSPARAWRDRREGVDCDCYSVFISSILLNLSIPHLLRITKYRQDYFQHIYPVVPTPTGEIVLDCVTNDFDYEVPYSEKKDFPMDLQFLNGLDDDPSVGDSSDWSGDGMGDLGKFRIKLPKIQLKKVLNVVNKINPVTVLLRNGVLAAMKLNIGGVAAKLRWSYLTPAQATAKGIDPKKFNKLVGVRKKLESIFYGAGGNPNNLKKAMLKGKGNKDKGVVAGLGTLDFEGIDYMSANTPLMQLLGPDIYYSENERTFQGFEGFGALGEPATLASLSAASGVIAVLVKALKGIGDLFGKKGQDAPPDENKASGGGGNAGDGGGDGSPASPPPAPSGGGAASDSDNAPSPPPANPSRRIAARMLPQGPSDASESPAAVARTANDGNAESDGDSSANVPSAALTTPVLTPAAGSFSPSPDTPATKTGFWEKNKSWLKPVAIGAGGLTLLVIGVHMMKPKPHPGGAPMAGLPGAKRKNHRRKSRKSPPKRAVALL